MTKFVVRGKKHDFSAVFGAAIAGAVQFNAAGTAFGISSKSLFGDTGSASGLLTGGPPPPPPPPPPPGNFYALPTQLQEQQTYDSVLGWAWTASDKVPNFASNPGPLSIFDIHGDVEADDLWNHYQMYKRTGLQLYLDWATRWRDYYVNSFYNQLITTSGQGDGEFGYDHLFGWGLVFWGVDRGDSAALTAAQQIATLVEQQTAGLTAGSTFMNYWNGRQYSRWLIMACYIAQAFPIARWITLRDKLINCWMQSPDWEDEANSPIVWGGGYFVGRDALQYTGNGLTAADWDAGKRVNFGTYVGITAEALWRAYLSTGRTDVRNRLIAMAKFVYRYAHTPHYVNAMVGDWFGHNKGFNYNLAGAGQTNPNTASAQPAYEHPVINILVMGYKLTGHKGFLQRAHVHLRKGTQYDEGTFAQACTATEVEHYLDIKRNSDQIYFAYNKGEVQYDYLVFENGGAPTVEGAWPTYSVPTTIGQVVMVGTNTAASVRPSTHSIFDWDFALFRYYGGGTLCEDYSTGGAFVIAGSGGHNVPPNIGACLFDFQDVTWKRVYTGGTTTAIISGTTVHGMPMRSNDYTSSEISGSGELIGASPAGIPAPAHLLSFMQQRRQGHDGGNKGSILLLQHAYQGVTASNGSTISHSFNLETGIWTRTSVNNVLGGGSEFWTSAYDRATNRYYMGQRSQTGRALEYLDGNDWTWKLLGGVNFTHGVYTQNCFIDDFRHIMIWPTDLNQLVAIDLDSPGSSVALTKTGVALPGNTSSHWFRNPKDGCFYTHLGQGGNIVYKLQPPPESTSPMSGTWTVSTITLSQSLIAHDGVGGDANQNRFFFVPSLQCFAWIANATSQVALIKL